MGRRAEDKVGQRARMGMLRANGLLRQLMGEDRRLGVSFSSVTGDRVTCLINRQVRKYRKGRR